MIVKKMLQLISSWLKSLLRIFFMSLPIVIAETNVKLSIVDIIIDDIDRDYLFKDFANHEKNNFNFFVSGNTGYLINKL